MSAFVYVDAGGLRQFVPVEWCELCGMSMPADHEAFRHADNPHLQPVRTNGPAEFSDEAALSSTATDCQESEAMSNPSEVPHAETRQGRQMTAAIAIAKACEHDLPDIHHWIIDRDQVVKGMVHSDRWLANLTAWAEYLAPDKDHVPQPRVNRSRTDAMATVEVTGVCHRVAFRIFHTATTRELAEFRARRQAS